MTVKQTLTAARNVPWAPTLDLHYDGDALPDIDSVAIQVRQYPGAAGDPELEDASVAFTDFADPTDDRPTRRTLRLEPSLAQTDLDAAPTGLNEPEPGQPDVFAYDIVITYADAAQERPVAGSFLLEPGVTI